MSGDASWPLQQALFQILGISLTSVLPVDDTVSPPVAKIYDYVPEDTLFPYVTIGETTVIDDGHKTKTGQEHTVNIHTWTQTTQDKAGRKQAKEILAAVYDCLHEKPLTITGHNLVSCRFEFASSIDLDADAKTWHGVHRYRIRTEPA